MSWLSSATLRGLIQPFDGTKVALIEPVLKERFQFIEGSSYDLTLIDVFERKGQEPAFFGIEARWTPEQERIEPVSREAIYPYLPKALQTKEEYAKIKGFCWFLPPGLYQLRFLETVTVPYGIVGLVLRRVSLGLGGALTFGTKVPPGYSGKIRTTLVVEDPCGAIFESNTLAATLGFISMDSMLPRDMDLYSGSWMGDRMSTKGVIKGS